MSVLPEVVVSRRLILRQWRPTDVVILSEAIKANIDHLRPWMPWIESEPLSDSDREDLIRSWQQDWIDAGDVIFGAFSEGGVVGGCGLHKRAGPETLEIGYWVHIDHLQRGFATEMARELTTAALVVTGVERVEIHHDRGFASSPGGCPCLVVELPP